MVDWRLSLVIESDLLHRRRNIFTPIDWNIYSYGVGNLERSPAISSGSIFTAASRECSFVLSEILPQEIPNWSWKFDQSGQSDLKSKSANSSDSNVRSAIFSFRFLVWYGPNLCQDSRGSDNISRQTQFQLAHVIFFSQPDHFCDIDYCRWITTTVVNSMRIIWRATENIGKYGEPRLAKSLEKRLRDECVRNESLGRFSFSRSKLIRRNASHQRTLLRATLPAAVRRGICSFVYSY